MVVVVVPFTVIDTSLTTVFAEPLPPLPPLFSPLPVVGWAVEPDPEDALVDWAEALVDWLPATVVVGELVALIDIGMLPGLERTP